MTLSQLSSTIPKRPRLGCDPCRNPRTLHQPSAPAPDGLNCLNFRGSTDSIATPPARTTALVAMQPPDRRLFQEILLDILRLHPEGLSEYALLQRLRQDSRVDFESERLDRPEDLFRVHFLLFHHLYVLRDELRSTQRGELEIQPLNIRWRLPLGEAGNAADGVDTEGALACPDPLADYYRDLTHLAATTGADVDRLLGQFWARFERYDRRAEALSVLELDSEADAASIQCQYRRLAMRHHPDRGGDPARLQAINAAMAILAPRKPSV